MSRILVALTLLFGMPLVQSGELPTRKSLNLAAIKAMVAGAEAEAINRKIQVTICIVDENANLLFLQKADGASMNTITYAQKKAKHSAIYRQPSKNAGDLLKAGNLGPLIQPDGFPNQGGLPIRVDGQVIGAMAASGAKSEDDEAVAQAGIDALMAWLKQ